MDSASFFSALFQDKPEDTWILVWTLQDKRSVWCKTPEAAASTVAGLGSKDVYVGVALAPDPVTLAEGKPTSSIRCPADKVAGIVGLWIDLDIADPQSHKKGNLPPTVEAARGLLSRFPAPTILVHSGHGLQGWWLFREPLIFATPEERRETEEISARWSASIRREALARGWDVDSTWDLARILRVPGTTNHKSNPVPVRVLEENGPRYNLSDFEPYLVSPDEVSLQTKLDWAAGEIDGLDPSAAPPFEKFQALMELDPKFKLSWEYKRRDLQDKSPSAYDLSLASIAAGANWTDQEITDLLIACRRQHKEDLKLGRKDYYLRTVAKARQQIRKDHAMETLEEVAAVSQEEGKAPEDKKPEILASLSEVLGVRITRIIKYLADQPTYRLETPQGNILLGEVQNLITQNLFRNKVAAAAGRYIPQMKQASWSPVAQLLLDACEEESIGDEVTDGGIAGGWLTSYFAEKTVQKERSEIGDAALLPFVEDGAIRFFGTNLRQWLVIAQGEKVSPRTMGAVLRSFGCTPESISVRQGGRRTSKSGWRVPPEKIPPM